jgi:excisionase family DNA binding protein
VDSERLLSLKEAAAQFGLSPSHLRLLARTGRLAAVRMGRDWFTTPTAVAAYLANPELRSRNPHKRQHRC